MNTSDEPPAGHGPLSPRRVLVVDDSRDCADSTAQLLTLAGLEARACYDGRTALELAAAFRPGVCLLDLNMPEMDGDELAARLRAQVGDRPPVLVAVTAMGGAEYRARTTAAFDLHLVKPVDPANLVSMVEFLFRASDETVASAKRAAG
jgi:DNA-binding response OmpR family regulator